MNQDKPTKPTTVLADASTTRAGWPSHASELVPRQATFASLLA